MEELPEKRRVRVPKTKEPEDDLEYVKSTGGCYGGGNWGPPEIEELDFSEFHPLDHSIWLCSGWYGGIPRHFQLWWYVIGEPWIMSNTRCRLRWHNWSEGWQRNDNKEYDPMWICRFCEIQQEREILE